MCGYTPLWGCCHGQWCFLPPPSTLRDGSSRPSQSQSQAGARGWAREAALAALAQFPSLYTQGVEHSISRKPNFMMT